MPLKRINNKSINQAVTIGASILEISFDFFVGSVPPKPIKNGGVPVTKFLSGWHPKVVYSGFAPTYLLALEHDDGRWTIWFLDEDMDRLGGSFAELPPVIRNKLVLSCCTLFDGIWNGLVVAAKPIRLHEKQRSFLRLPAAIRHQMLDLFLDRFDFSTGYQHISDGANLPGSGKVIDLGSRRILLDRNHLDFVFDPNALQNAYPLLLQTGIFSWPSPIDGRKLCATHSYCLDGNRFAYRLVDDVHDITFYLIAEEIHFRIACVYIPEIRLAMAPDPEHLQSLMPDLSRSMFNHVIEHGEALDAYLDLPAQKVVHAWRGRTAMHLGHVLWNDISGIASLVTSVPEQQLPQFLVFDSSASPEMYGPLDDIFPEIRGKVVRHTGTLHAAIPSFYRDRVLLIKATGMQVTRFVRERIISRFLKNPTNAACVAACRTKVDRGDPIVILGLRTENRTLTDLSGFCERLLDFLIKTYARMTIVIDGHNSRYGSTDQCYLSHGEFSTDKSVKIELGIVSVLQQRAAATGIHVVSTIGLPLANSLIWGIHSDVFITPWGAGLAKYRWICNKPGLVLTSRWNLQNLGGFRIYDDPRCLEDSAPMEFIDPTAVQDRPEAPLLVPLGKDHIPSIMNFDLDEQAVFKAVTGLLRRYADV